MDIIKWWINFFIDLFSPKTIEVIPIVQPIVTPKGDVKPMTKEEEFVNNLTVLRGYGFDIRIPYSQACLETGYFKSVIGKHNYWGLTIKVGWKGLTVNEVQTFEYEKCHDCGGTGIKNNVTCQSCIVIVGSDQVEIDNGVHYVKYPQRRGFIDFDICSDSMEYYNWKVNNLYPVSYANRQDYKVYFTNLSDWATARDYSQTNINLFEQLDTNGTFDAKGLTSIT